MLQMAFLQVGNPLSYCPRRDWLWNKAKEAPELVKLQQDIEVTNHLPIEHSKLTFDLKSWRASSRHWLS